MTQWRKIYPPIRGHGFDPRSGKIPRAGEQLSPCTTTLEPELQSPGAATTEASVPRASPPQREKSLRSVEDAAQPKINKLTK